VGIIGLGKEMRLRIAVERCEWDKCGFINCVLIVGFDDASYFHLTHF
jgi:hypothetical protein